MDRIKLRKLRELVTDILKTNYIYIIGIMLLTFKGILLNLMLGIDIKEMYLITVGIPLVILLPIINKPHRTQYRYLNITYLLLTFLIYANYLYYSYSTNFISIYQVENLAYAEEIGMGLQYLINIKDIAIFFLDNIILAILSVYILKKNNKEHNSIYVKEKRIFKIAIIILVLIINERIITGRVEAEYKEYIYNRTNMIEHISIYYYYVEDIKEYISGNFLKPKVDYNKLSEIYDENKNNRDNDAEFIGVAEGKNVIVVQLESMSQFLINKTINGEEITPNLNKFYKENIYFTNMYNQGLGTTADSEHTISTSMYPLENGQVFQKYYNNNWDDTYSILKKEGYYTSVMHPNVDTFWNRNRVYYVGYKVDKYENIKDFNDNGEMAGQFFSDEQFLVQAVEKMNNYREPFYTMLIAISTHIPYELEGIKDLESKLSIDVSNIDNDEFSRYLLSCNFVDYCFGKFLEEMEKTNLLENSVLIVYGDHGAGIQAVDEIKKIYDENNLEYTDSMEIVENVHIPFGMKIPGVSSRVINEAKSKIDVKPTIFDLLGVKDGFSLGENLFSSKDYSFIKDIGIVTSKEYFINEELIDRSTNKTKEITESILSLNKKMKDEMLLSDTIIKNNLLLEIKERFK